MKFVRIPLLNANEDEVVVSGVHVAEGDEVRAGELLVSVESTKATMDVEAPMGGFVRQLAVTEGERVEVGALVCVITQSADEAFENPALEEAAEQQTGRARATRRARALAEEHGIELESLDVRGIVKERDVRRYLERAAPGRGTPAVPVSSDRIAVYGAGGHARVIVDLLRESRRDLTLMGVVDDGDEPPEDVMGVPVLGGWAQLAALREQGVRRVALGVGAVTHNRTRVELFRRLTEAGFELPNLVHARASVEPSVRMGHGNQVFAGAVVGSNVTLADNTIINSGTVVSHDCVVGSHAHLTPGAILAGGVRIGENTVIGMGVTLYLGVRVGRDAVISNGVHVMKDVPDGAVVRGTAS